MKSAIRNLAACAVASTLVACGGGGGSTPSAASSTTNVVSAATGQGVYTGTLTGGASTAFELLLLENGETWMLYGTPGTSSFLVRGFVQGTAAVATSSFSAASVKDYGTVPPTNGALSGTVSGQTVSGTIAEGGQSVAFTGAVLTGASYDYNTAATLAQVAGNWTLTGLDGTLASVTIATDGTLTGSNAGCLLTGSVKPRASGKSVFDVTVTSGASPCTTPGATSTGFALTYLVNGTALRQLLVAATNAAKTGGIAYFGVR
ncbi:MAG: hypothetical protein ACXWC6_08750 [Ramlibacter sp.]